MWSTALYALRIHHKLFWRLTPRQYDLLMQRHHEALAHREMVGAFTTTAVINHSFCPPEKPVAPLRYMPHYDAGEEPPTPATPQQIAFKAEYDSKVTSLTAELKVYAATGEVGPMLRAMGYGEKANDADNK